MLNFDRNHPSRKLRRIAGFALMLTVAAVLASCGAPRDRVTTHSIPDDYRTRHPITLAEVEHSLDVPVGTGEYKLTPATRDLIRGFGQEYATRSKSIVQIAVPANTPNAGSASKVRAEVRRVLTEMGIPSSRILLTRYDAAQANASAPIRLSYVAITAITDDCGQWPSDLVVGKTMVQNKNYENFGCATQQNLAAQIANPTDLIGPRGMTPIDAANRASVIKVYRGDTGE